MKFTKGNSYLPKGTYTFNLPSGFTCPGASDCLAYANRETGKLTKGRNSKWTCYSARTERFPAVRKNVWENFDALKGKTADQMAELILASIPLNAKYIRIHANGDFFSQTYFDAWLSVCRKRTDILFWAFTKSVHFWVTRIDSIPPNLKLQASYGGKHDHLIAEHNLKFALVVNDADEAKLLGLTIDTDDTLAHESDAPFALLLGGSGRSDISKVRDRNKK